MKTNRIKQKCWIGISFLLFGFLTACGKHVTNTNISQEETKKIEITTVEIEGPADMAPSKDNSPQQTDRNARIKEYQSVLEAVYDKHTFPDGNDYGFDDHYDISENRFAVNDIDHDGNDELIIEYKTTAMAGMVEKIYDFDRNTNAVTEEFEEFPNLTFYDNGIIEAGLSHNQGLAGDFWPYSLYKYDNESDSYRFMGTVDAWDKSVAETGYDEKPFPKEIDKNGNGIVYYITSNGTTNITNPIDKEKYDQWHDSYVGNAKKVNIPFMKLTKENIDSIK